jgi:hypothetical protein
MQEACYSETSAKRPKFHDIPASNPVPFITIVPLDLTRDTGVLKESNSRGVQPRDGSCTANVSPGITSVQTTGRSERQGRVRGLGLGAGWNLLRQLALKAYQACFQT